MREMKDSGIEWIGEIPKDWKVKRCKNISNFINGYAFDSKAFQNDFLYSVIRIGDIKEGYIDNINCLGVSNNKGLDRYLIKENDILLAMSGATVGKVGIAHGIKDAYINQRVGIIRTTSSRFLFYCLSTREFIEYILLRTDGSAQPNVSGDVYGEFYIPYPRLEEQNNISDLLDTKCSEIDAITEDIQKEISLLEDYKKSLIYNVISNGINHSAYSTETDEVWGNVPQGWKLVDIKYLFEIVKRIAGKEGYDVLSVTQKGLKVKDITSGDGQLADNYSGYQFVYPTDYVMNHMDLLTGWVDCSELFGVTSPDYRVFRLMDKAANNLVYYKYVMQCCYMNKIFYLLGQGVSNLGRWRLQTSSFNNFKVPAPPKDEQDEIADFLDTKCSEIDTLIADKKRQLNILGDYKKSLIYEYVTGKKEVPVKDF